MTVNIKRSSHPTPVEKFFLWVVSPLQSFFTLTVDSVADVIDGYFYFVNTTQENEGLKEKVDQLSKENNYLKEEVRRLARIAQLADYQNDRKLNSITATVIGKDATQWVKMVFVNKGTQDGVRENQPVVTETGIVGHILQAGTTTSKVLLIVDSRSAVDALFQESRVSGVVSGNGTEECNMKYVPIGAPVEIGDLVLSSGLGGVFPKGLLVGRVKQVTQMEHGLFKDIIVTPTADLSRLEEVLILLS